jgi:predicted RNase H-like HicB family nuclease
MKEQLTAVFQKVPEGYIAFVEELPGANSQGDTLEEARSNLREAVQLVLEANRSIAKEALGDTSVIREPLAQISWSGSIWSAIWKGTALNYYAKVVTTAFMWTAKAAKFLQFHVIAKSTNFLLRRFVEI